MNNENLIPQAHVLTVGEQSKGGKASGKARREKKTLRELVEMLNNLPATEKNAQELRTKGVKEKYIVNKTVYLAAVLSHALKGHGTAMRLWAELSGEKTQEEAGATGGAPCTVTFEFADTALKDENEDNNT